jgi:hypothetical protein
MRSLYTKPRNRLDRDTILAGVDWLAFWQSELPSMPAPKRSHGWTCGGCNPLRADARPGSFRVSLDSGGWIDYADGTKGDAIEWLRLRHALDFREALEVLAEYCA